MVEQDSSGDPTPPSDSARKTFYAALNEYQQLVEGSEIVASSITGNKPGFRTGHIWNVLARDYAPEEMKGHDFEQLHEGAARAIAGSREYMPLRIAHVLPSHVAELVRRYQEDGYDLKGVQDVGFEGAPSNVQVEVSDLDILVGGALSANEGIGMAQGIATEARQYYNRENDDLYNLTIFDGLKDREAGDILKDIALARNSIILPPNMASAFELMAEPTRVAGEIIGNIFNEALLDSITILDVRNAIESGSLAPHYGLPRRQ